VVRIVVLLVMMMSDGSSIIHHGRNINQCIHLAPLVGAEDLVSNVRGDLATVLLVSVVKAAMAVAHAIFPRLFITAIDGTSLATTSRFVDGLVLLSLKPVLDAHTIVTASAGRKVTALDGALGGIGNRGRHREKIVNDIDRCLDGILRLFFLDDGTNFLDGRSSLGFIAGCADSSCRMLGYRNSLGGFVMNVQWRELSLGGDDAVLLCGDGSLLPWSLVQDKTKLTGMPASFPKEGNPIEERIVIEDAVVRK